MQRTKANRDWRGHFLELRLQLLAVGLSFSGMLRVFRWDRLPRVMTDGTIGERFFNCPFFRLRPSKILSPEHSSTRGSQQHSSLH